VHASASFDNRKTYDYTDRQPLTGNNFYRLKQVDIDGQFEYSKVVQVKQKENTGLATIYPNPVQYVLQIRLNNTNRQNHIAIYDAMGKRLYSKQVRGEPVVRVPVFKWSTGTYTVQITHGASKQVFTFIKQ
jgi:hypothetical protein